jgi:hypothetical protein
MNLQSGIAISTEEGRFLSRPCGSRARLRTSSGCVLVRINALPAEAIAHLVWHLNQAATDEELPLLGVHDSSDQMWMAKQAH